MFDLLTTYAWAISLGLLLLFIITGRTLIGGIGAALGTYLLLKIMTSTLATQQLVVEFLNATIITAELALLIAGAYLFFLVQELSGRFEPLKEYVAAQDSRLTVALLLAWFLGSFLEGVAGFGTPAMLIAPLLFSLGFSALSAVVLPLAANTLAVNFGALGTPVKVGLGSAHLTPAATQEVVNQIVWLNWLPALVLPWLLALILARLDKSTPAPRREWKSLLLAGVCFAVPFSSALWLGVELGSVLAGGVGLLAFSVLRLPGGGALRLFFNTFWPYLVFVGLLLPTKYLLGGASVQKYYQEVPLRTMAYFQPGVVFLLTTLLLFLFNRSIPLQKGIQSTWTKLKNVLVVIFLLVFFTRLIGVDVNDFVRYLTHTLGPTAWLALAPLLGIVGTFITGSATVSNMMFGTSLLSAGGASTLLAALLNTGSAIGNALSLQNILMVKSTLPEPVADKAIYRRTIPVVVVYYLVIVLVAFGLYTLTA
ncbi:L-lactate permease [Rhabdobacter roseus]|uniref:L-lactate permease n=1 Tax=Rhabdobacter roseus TaxID=1655419 RepID=A0A840TQ96_9BACT|nr:L-lactate permease [Rhabdobacter roseus]MBB5283413.1 L-lactate permease [Rhabdobacter roseus]